MSDQTIFIPIKHLRAAEEIILQIEELLLDGILRDGDKLPGERELAAQLDVSRPILREALKELESRGLLISRHGGGTYVADIVGESFSLALSSLITRHPRAAQDYLEYRRAMEALSAELAATRATEQDLAILEAIISRMVEAHEAQAFETGLQCDIEFHNAIGEAAHNVVLLHSLRSCYHLLKEDVLLNRKLIVATENGHANILQQHIELFQAIQSRNPDAARAAATAHIDYVAQSTKDAGERLAREQRSAARKALRQP